MRLGLSDTLATTARVLLSGFPTFFVAALIFTAPAVLLDRWLLSWRFARYQEAVANAASYGWVTEPSGEELMRVSVLALGASWLVGAFCIGATQAGVLYTVVERLAGRKPSFGAAIGKATLRLPAAIGAMVLVSCAVLFSSSCLVVPAIVLAALFYFAVPAAVVEELSPFRAVARSVDLTHGNRVLVLGLVAAILLFFAGVRFGLRVWFGAPEAFAVEAADFPAALPGWPYHAAMAAAAIAEAMILAVLSSVMYARLRARDGIDIEELAEVFS